MFVAACCFGGGFLISSLGVSLHQIWLVYLGYGVIGGIGLGLGYVSPVSTLIKWFPDRRGHGYYGLWWGAMIGAPLPTLLMDHYKTATSAGVIETFIVLGCLYFVSMLSGSLRLVSRPKIGSLKLGFHLLFKMT